MIYGASPCCAVRLQLNSILVELLANRSSLAERLRLPPDRSRCVAQCDLQQHTALLRQLKRHVFFLVFVPQTSTQQSQLAWWWLDLAPWLAAHQVSDHGKNVLIVRKPPHAARLVT